MQSDDTVAEGAGGDHHDRRALLKRVGVGAAVVWATPAIISQSAAAAATGPPPPVPCPLCGAGNLVVNPSFETNTPIYGAGDATLDAHGWTTGAGTPRANRYDNSVGFPGGFDAKGGGAYFAYGGQSGDNLSTTSQTISIGACATAIDAGRITFRFSAYLGGFQAYLDTSTVEVQFLDGGNNPVGSPFTIGPVTPADRGNRTTMLLRQLNGGTPTPVPSGARSARVTCTMKRIPEEGDTFVDGYIDDVDFSLLCFT